MTDRTIRRHIAIEAAKLMYERTESEYYTAKRKAAARLGLGQKTNAQCLPSNREIREQIQILAQLHEGDARRQKLARMRLAALRIMRWLHAFRPRLIGSVCTGHIRNGSDIDIHVFSDSASAVADVLHLHRLDHTIERKRIIKHNEERIFTHIHITADFDYELTVYSRDKHSYVFKSSITGKPIERLEIDQLDQLIRNDHPDLEEFIALPDIDRFMI